MFDAEFGAEVEKRIAEKKYLKQKNLVETHAVESAPRGQRFVI